MRHARDEEALGVMKRVIVIVNKWWECDPALLAMLNDNARPNGSPWPNTLHPPRPRPNPLNPPQENPNPQPRAIFPYNKFIAEVWCISDLLEHLSSIYQSSSEQKIKYLPRVLAYGAPPDMVVGLGTAATPYDTLKENGNVFVGSKIFMHNAHPNGTNPNSNWTTGPFDQIVESSIDRTFFEQLSAIDKVPPTIRYLASAINPAFKQHFAMEFDYVALGTINVTDYAEYNTMDPRTVQAYSSSVRSGMASSLETTHGLIRVQSNSPFVFVSGITDRVGHFDDEVTPRSHAQNTAAAHNAGLICSWLLARLDQIL